MKYQILNITISRISSLAVAVLIATVSVFAADFDKDGKADFAVFEPSTTTWISDASNSDGRWTITRWGNSNDVLVPADYDGDGRTDFAVWRPSNSTWYINQSGDGQALLVKWGMANGVDVPVPADYDGDRLADIAVWRPTSGEWMILRSSDHYRHDDATVIRWGKSGDVPVQGDYDGDGRTDTGVFRPTENRWYILESKNGKTSVHDYGIA